MRAGGRPGPVKMRNSPPAYPMHQESIGTRSPLIYIPFILWRVSLVNHSILPTRIIRKLPLPLATQCSPTYRLSGPRHGNDNLLIMYSFQFIVFALNLLILCGGKAKPSKRVKKNKQAEETTVNEPELQPAAPEASVPEPPLEPVYDMPMMTADPPVVHYKPLYLH